MTSSTHLPQLKRLNLSGALDIIDTIISSPYLTQLEFLDLGASDITPAGRQKLMSAGFRGNFEC